MLLYKREVLGGDPHLWIPMDPYWIGGTLKAPAVQKKRQATPCRKPPIASAQHPKVASAMLWFTAAKSAGGLAYCRLVPDENAPRGEVRALPMVKRG